MSFASYRRSGVVLVTSLVCALSSASAGISEQTPTTGLSCQDFSQTLQKAAEKHSSVDYSYFPIFSESAKSDMSAGMGGGSDVSSSMGRTTGVEELDVFKVTNRYFVQSTYNEINGQVLEIYSLSGEKIKTLTSSDLSSSAGEGLNIQGVIATDNQLVVVTNIWSAMPVENMDMRHAMPTYQPQSGISIFDLRDLQNPKRSKDIKLSATVQSAYISQDKLTVVTQGANGYDFATKKYSLPQISVQQNGKKEVMRSIDCNSYSFFSGALESRSMPVVTMILTQSLSDLSKKVVDSGFVGNPNMVYFTGDHMYASLVKDRNYTPKCSMGVCPSGASYYGSDLYAFTAKEGVFSLTARTMIPGQVLSPYSIQHFKDSLVVLSQESPNWELMEGTRLSIYNPTTLKKISTLPRIAPGESLGGVRFDGDMLYFVTYRSVDPVFKIDLSNPKKPKLLGALKIPGFSNLLMRYDQSHMISVGMDSKDIKDDYGNVINTEVGGVKVDLYDVSKNTPVVVASQVFGGTGSQLFAYDMKQLIFDAKTGLLTIPVSITATGATEPFVGALNLSISPKGIAVKNMFRTDTDVELKTWFESRCSTSFYPDPDDRPIWCARGFDAVEIRKKRSTYYSYEFAPSNIIRTGNVYYLRAYDRMWKVDTTGAKDATFVDAVRMK